MNRTLIQAAGKCDVDLVMRTLAGEFGPVEERDINDAILRAAQVGYADIIVCLLAKGADPDAEDPYGETPLIHAAAGNHIRALRMIVNAGADINWINDSGRTGLHLAVKNNCAASVLLLLRSGTACDTDIQDDDWETPLMVAAQSGNALMMQMLTQSKANVNLQNRERATALHKAIVNGSKMCVMLLIDAKPDVNVKDIKGDTPLLLACQHGHDEIGVMLMDLKPDVDGKDRNGKCPLDYALEKQLPGITECLIAEGAMNQSQATDLTHVMASIQSGNKYFLKALFSANYDLGQKGNIQIGGQEVCCTPLEAALRLGHIDMSSLLILGGSELQSVMHWVGNSEEMPSEVAQNDTAKAWLMIMPRRPCGLRSLSRKALRKQLGFCPIDPVKSLTKSRAVQQFILFQKY